MLNLVRGLLVAAIPTCSTGDTKLESLIDTKTKELAGQEHCQFRFYDALEDLDGDQQPDLAVVFTVSQALRGQKDVQFVAVFLTTEASQPRLAEVARTREAVVIGVKAWPPDITLDVLEYRAADALCCPTLSAVRVYRVAVGGGLTLTRRGRNRQDIAFPPVEPSPSPASRPHKQP